MSKTYGGVANLSTGYCAIVEISRLAFALVFNDLYPRSDVRKMHARPEPAVLGVGSHPITSRPTSMACRTRSR
jgi:hypothetical protein